jgi:hypothetical protein
VRIKWWTLAVPIMAACGTSSSPTSPTVPGDPRFFIRFTLTNQASLSLSEPVLCPDDWSTCSRDSQPQGSATTGSITTRNYTLAPGTYRLTGVLQPSTPIGASVAIEIGADATATRSGVAREGPVLGFVKFTGDAPPQSSVVSLTCGATFTNASGALEWSMAFRVVSASPSVDQVCH